MRPRDRRQTPQEDLFRSELANLLDQRHPLGKLAGRIDWSVFEQEWGELFKGVEISGVKIFRSGQRRGVNTRALKRELKRRSAIEAVIGHLKTDGRMDRCRLKGALGDALNAVLVAAGHNLRLLLRAMANLLRRILGRLIGQSMPELHGRNAELALRAAA